MRTDDRPAWARRMTREREARGWSQAEAVRALQAHSTGPLRDHASLLGEWRRWESGEQTPGDAYRPLIAQTFGTVTHAFFPVPGRRATSTEILAGTGIDTVGLLDRLQPSDVDAAAIDGLRIVVDRLCSEYPYLPGDQLLAEGRRWFRRLAGLRGQRLTLARHRDVLSLTGWLALLIGCVEYDMGRRHDAEAARQQALALGTETGDAEVVAWAQEMRAWIALTTGDHDGVITAARAGLDVTARHPVAVQLAAQEAKAWARLGDRRQAEVALDRGRRLLDSLPCPGNLDHHFVVDPDKFDFYAMDCYRQLGNYPLARSLAETVIGASVDPDGTERAPMRLAEARVTLGVAAAHDGDLEQAVQLGGRALNSPRRSLPSLLMVSRDLIGVLRERYPSEAATKGYLDEFRALAQQDGRRKTQ